MNVIFTTITTDKEIQQLLDLQELNLTKNISEDVANDQGFVTVIHNFDLLSRMNQSVPQIIAKDGDEVVGYALVMPESFRFDIPVLTAMFELMDGLKYKGKLIKDTQYYAMGQICVAEGYRGMGVFDGLYAKHKENLSDRFELCVTEIAKRNTRSLAAHKRVGFEIIYEYFDTTYPELWEVVAWDFKLITNMKITRKTLLKTLTAGLITIPSFGKRQMEKDLLGFKAEFADAWKRSEEYTLTVFNQMPEAKLEYKYTPESFSFRTQFVHCIIYTAAQLSGRLSITNPYEKTPPSFWAKLSKSDLENELRKFYAWVQKIVNETKTESLLKQEDYAGGSLPIWRFFYAMENHIIHHRGQAICYLRLNEVIPEGYVGW